MRNAIVAAAAATLALGVLALPASAQSYRYHKDCYWTGSGWGYKYGGKVLVCRPHRPHGGGWYWHSHGGKHGWYHRQHKRWHYDKW